METSIIGSLVFCIMFAGGTYYLGYHRPIEPFAWKAQASFIATTFLLIPSLLIVLWLQSDAQNKLAEAGFTPLPSIQQSVGIAVGRGDNPTWVFETTQDQDSIFDFYRNKQNRQGWELVSDNSVMLIFKKEKEKMVILSSEGRLTNTLIFSLQQQESDTAGKST